MRFLLSFALLGVALGQTEPLSSSVAIVLPPGAAPRVAYGADRLVAALREAGREGAVVPAAEAPHHFRQVRLGIYGDSALLEPLPAGLAVPGPEGFVLATEPNNLVAVAGADDSGLLYGCLELARRTKAAHGLPETLAVSETPAFPLRGPALGLQKPTPLPGYGEYEYPLTPELFPFFYDKAFWAGYLDFLAENRLNTLYLWSGHPFASLVRLPDYPEALEVSAAGLDQNTAIYRYVIQEADKRGIRLVQMFSNIELSKPFAERHGLATQPQAPTPLAADYTRKSIAAFVRQYPQVGLMVCLGEALQGVDQQRDWFVQVILPGLQDGLRQSGRTDQPSIILRTPAIDAAAIVTAGVKVYPHIETEENYNGESLTTWAPRGARQALHQAMSRLAAVHIADVHLLANLEPFRYGDQRFIKLSVRAMRDRLGAKGLHFSPLSSWNWPYAPDKTAEPLLQYQRDWIWFEAWARYAWNPDIPDAADHAYWVARLARIYGSGAAENILAAYNDSGECAPRIARRFGLTEGNRQTLSLGMTLDQLVEPGKYRASSELVESQSPPGERLQEFADREWNKQPHEGETPPRIMRDILHYSEAAMREIDAAAAEVTDNQEEFGRLLNDVHCIREMALNYAAKAQAALLVLRYRHTHDVADMESAERLLAISLDHFRALARLTAESYQYANSRQTAQRTIPVAGGIDGRPANAHWSALLPVYEKELADFHTQVAALRSQTR